VQLLAKPKSSIWETLCLQELGGISGATAEKKSCRLGEKGRGILPSMDLYKADSQVVSYIKGPALTQNRSALRVRRGGSAKRRRNKVRSQSIRR